MIGFKQIEFFDHTGSVAASNLRDTDDRSAESQTHGSGVFQGGARRITGLPRRNARGRLRSEAVPCVFWYPRRSVACFSYRASRPDRTSKSRPSPITLRPNIPLSLPLSWPVPPPHRR